MQRAEQKAGNAQTISQERRRLVAAQAERAEIQTQRLRGEFYSKAEVRIALFNSIRITASHLDGLAGRVAGQVANMTDAGLIRKFLFDECRRIRKSAADEFKAFAWALAAPDGKDAETTK